jgi:hypothetical protein
VERARFFERPASERAMAMAWSGFVTLSPELLFNEPRRNSRITLATFARPCNLAINAKTTDTSRGDVGRDASAIAVSGAALDA